MKPRHLFRKALLLSFTFVPAIAHAQGTQADYDRANSLRKTFQDAAINIPERANWIEKTSRFWYRRSVKGGNEVIIVDAETKTRKPAFDHERVAASLSAASGEKLTGVTLPVNALTFGKPSSLSSARRDGSAICRTMPVRKSARRFPGSFQGARFCSGEP